MLWWTPVTGPRMTQLWPGSPLWSYSSWYLYVTYGNSFMVLTGTIDLNTDVYTCIGIVPLSRRCGIATFVLWLHRHFKWWDAFSTWGLNGMLDSSIYQPMWAKERRYMPAPLFVHCMYIQDWKWPPTFDTYLKIKYFWLIFVGCNLVWIIIPLYIFLYSLRQMKKQFSKHKMN